MFIVLYDTPGAEWYNKCSIRVSNELGSGRPQAAHLIVHVALSMVATKGILVATVMILGRNVWGNCYSKDEEVRPCSVLLQLLKQRVLVELKRLIWRGFFRSYFWIFKRLYGFAICFVSGLTCTLLALFWQQQNYYGVDLTPVYGSAFQGYFSQ
ncbi:protein DETOXIFICATION 16-like, partial [Fagus crenata]